MDRLLPSRGLAGKLAVLSAVALLNILAAPLGHSQENPAYVWCSGNNNYTAGSDYQSNLALLLGNLSAVPASADRGYFHNASVGDWTNPDAVYGLVQCRGDVLAADCAVCLNSSASAALLRCPLRRRAAVRLGRCFLRFSDQRFFGIMDDTARGTLVNSNSARPLHLRPPADGPHGADLLPGGGGELPVRRGHQLFRLLRHLRAGTVHWGPVRTRVPAVPSGAEQRPAEGQDRGPGPRRQLLGQVRNRPLLREVGHLSAPAAAESEPAASGCKCRRQRRRRDPGRRSGRSWRIITIIVILLSLAVIALLLALLIHFRRRALKGMPLNLAKDQEEVMKAESLLFDLKALRVATRNFSEANKLGEGGFGPVYKGVLPDGQQIAVKRLSKCSGQGLAELRNEVVLVAKLQHRNLVRLLGFCLEEEEKMVIYEYLPNRSLDHFLFDPIKRQVLDWERRYKLIEGIARGLVYLHEDSRLRVIHRDLKASNVLLDENMNPKISDFGLAKLFGTDETHRNTSRIAGTLGYMAPEYVIRGHFSPKLDVFSFGILTLEIVTGQRNNNESSDSAHPIDLVSYVWHHWNEGTTLEVVDQSIADQCPRHEVIRCIHIGLLCIQTNPSDRPNMSEVALMLSSFSVTLLAPSKPAFALSSSARSQSEESGTDRDHQSSEGHNSNQSTHRPRTQSINEVTLSEVEPR